MRLSRFNPARLLFGPVFQKDVRTAGRRRATYIGRSLYGAALLGLVTMVFLGMRADVGNQSGLARLQRLQTLAPILAIVIMWFQFAALCLAAPILTGPTICEEKRARTLPTLMTTPLSAAQVVVGTLTSRLVQLVILALLATPLLLAIRIFGGLDARIVLAATCMGLSAAILGAALGLMFSVWHKRGTTAAVFGLLALALAMGAPSGVEAVLYFVLNEQLVPTGGATQAYPFHQQIFATCTPATMFFLTESAALGRDPMEIEVPFLSLRGSAVPLTVPVWAVNSLYNLLLAALVTAYTTGAMRRIMMREAGAEPASRRRRRAAAAEPEERLAGRSREVSDHPVLWREVRQATFGSRKWFRVVVVLAVLGLGVTYWYAGQTLYTREGRRFSLTELLDNEGLHAALMILGGIVAMVQPVFMTTGSIAGEREARTWETLLTTPLTGARIVLGKLVGVLRVQWFLPAVVLLHFCAIVASGHLAIRVPILLLFTYMGPALFFSSTGQLLSVIFKKTVTAAVCNLGLALALWLGTWISLGLASMFLDTGRGDFFDFAGSAFFALNPVAMAVSISEANVPHRSAWLSGTMYEIEGVHTHHLPAWGFNLLVAGVFGFYLLGAFAAISVAVRGFTRLSGRSS